MTPTNGLKPGTFAPAWPTREGAVIVRAILDAATTERSLLLATLYDRNGV
jgi:hypothetical protein